MSFKILLLFEFGVPSYRKYVLDWLNCRTGSVVSIISANDKFRSLRLKNEHRLNFFIGKGENRLYLFNPLRLIDKNVVISTFNLRRPHTWLFLLILPWKKWIFWGQAEWTSSNLLINFLRRILLSLSSGYIAYTPKGKKNLIDFGYPERKISVAFNTLDVPNHRLTIGGEYLLYFGRLQERKKIELIFPYLRELGLKMRIVGDGDYKASLVEMTVEQGVENLVEFYAGTYNNDEILEHFSSSACYFSPGHVGLGVVQAFAYGVPVFTLSSCSHAPEFAYCNDENSYLFNNFNDMVQSLEKLDFDSTEHSKKKSSAYEYYQNNLSIENVYKAFEYHLRD